MTEPFYQKQIQYKTNTLGTIHVINAFLPLLRAGVTKNCIIIGSSLGSTRVAQRTGVIKYSGYSMSKAALNIAAVRYASRYKDEGVIFLSITPGLVKTLEGRECDYYSVSASTLKGKANSDNNLILSKGRSG